MTRVTGVSAQEWLEFTTSPSLPELNFSAAGNAMGAAGAIGVADYYQRATKNQGDETYPVSVFEGMQTVANIARTKAHYNPLDPEGTGSLAHFIQFTQNIAEAPFLSLIKADTLEISQASHQSDQIINSFVDAFEGISQKDRGQVIKAVSSLASAALSYAGQTEKYSNFAQNLLAYDSNAVQFSLFSSKFEISQTSHKGTITFRSQYEVSRAIYRLSTSSWNEVKDIFRNQQKTGTKSWLDSMNTPKKDDGAKAMCLE